MTIADKLSLLGNTKTDLRQAINSIGGSLTTETPFSQYAVELADVAPKPDASSFSWDSATSTPEAAFSPGGSTITTIHQRMRRCILGRDGVRQYYLHPEDSTLKEDGTPAVLTGADGMVMVEIPKFYYRTIFVGTITTWFISAVPAPGYTVYPAFIKDEVEVDYRYYGAYDGCFFDASEEEFKSGLNLDNATSLIDFVNDYLASVAGAYPLVGVTRAEGRSLAANTGAGFRQVDFWLVNAVQLLFLVEHQTFNTQAVLGDGNTSGSYLPNSSNQNDSPHTIAGASNSLGNGSTDSVTGARSDNKPGIAFMSYRGIENWFGNCYYGVDGFNINANQAYVTNNALAFADDTATGYDLLGSPMPNSNGYVTGHQDIGAGFLPVRVGGSSSSYWCDQCQQSTTGWRTARFGGLSNSGVSAGGFCWHLNATAGSAIRYYSSRLSF